MLTNESSVVLLHVCRAEPDIEVVGAVLFPILLALLTLIVHDKILLVVRNVEELHVCEATSLSSALLTFVPNLSWQMIVFHKKV